MFQHFLNPVSTTYKLQRDLYMFNTTVIDLSILQLQLLIIRIVGIISISTMIKAEGNIYLMNIQHFFIITRNH